jgi:DNA-binding CsgD family transcriptional regulator
MHMETRHSAESNPTDAGPRTTRAAILLFALIAAVMGWDIALDYRAGGAVAHVAAEALIMALALCGALMLWRMVRVAQRHAEQLTVDLRAARLEAHQFREEAAEALQGLGEAIHHQFTRWSLTPAEREVALLLLKGLSHKEVAQARSTSDTTIRQQALAVYRKSGLRNRAELSAFFLEDLLLPVTER